MPAVTARRAAIIAAAVACLVYANAVLNGWAGDDWLVIYRNLRAHSVPAALTAWFSPYWPPPWQGAGLWRPLAILSYAVDWTLGGGQPWVFHLTNVALHGVATAMATRLALAWLPPAGALAAGLVFAAHPVHVEAVSNVVGRAELLAACGLLAAALAARRYRHVPEAAAARRWLAGLLLLVTLSLLTKEVAAVAVAVLALDQWLDHRSAKRPTAGLYLGVVTITLAWFFIWHSIAGPQVAGGASTAFYGVPRSARWNTMFPAQLEVVRLLVWPLDLASDYSPQTVPIRTTWTALATLGLAVAASSLTLAVAVARRAPAVTFGILCSVASYAPTSNFLFASGVVLAERALYLPALAPALAIGWAVFRAEGLPAYRFVLLACGLVIIVFSVKSVTRTPFWRTTETPIIEEAADHPENYRARIHLADLYAFHRDSARALAEYLAAEAIAENDPFIAEFSVNAALTVGNPELAIEEGVRAYRIAPRDWRPARWATQARLAAGRPRDAAAFARAASVLNPRSEQHATTYVEALRAAEAPSWRILLAAANADWLSGDLVQASARLDSLSAAIPRGQDALTLCPDLEIARLPVQALKPALFAGLPCPS